MKRILIISYLFPPASALDGSMRMLKFVKYLPNFGYKPYVISVRDAFLSEDKTLLSQIPTEAHVARIIQFDLRYLLRLFKKRRASENEKVYSARFTRLRKIISSLMFPDSAGGWIVPAVLTGLRLIKKEKIDIILATAGPYSSLIVGYLLKIVTGKPLILDYRDLQIQGKVIVRLDIAKRFKSSFEKKILNCADVVVTASAVAMQKLIRSTGLPADKFQVITNGFDPDDFKLCQAGSGEDVFNIYYSGYLYLKRTPFLFFETIERLINKGFFKHQVNIRIFGRVEKDVLKNKSVAGLLKSNNLIIEGMLPYADSIKKLNQSDILLAAVDTDATEMLPAKLFEYMMFDKPILVIGPPGAAAVDMVNNFHLGKGVDYSDGLKIEEAIKELYNTIKINGAKLQRDNKVIGQFERKVLTKKLVEIAESQIR